MELKPIEKLAIAQAIYKKIAAIVSTKDADSLRAQCDADMRTNYENTGAKSYDVVINDKKVGTYSVKTSKPRQDVIFDIENMNKYIGWCIDNNCINADDKQAMRIFESTGEVPDGVKIRTVERPGGYAGTTLKIDENDVIDALGDALQENAVKLLEGGATWE